MRLAQDDNMIHTLAPDRLDQIFGKAVLPRRGRCRRLVPDAHRAHSSCDDAAVDLISISDHVPGASFQGKASVSWRAIYSAVGFVVNY